jgi:hypothetical protein
VPKVGPLCDILPDGIARRDISLNAISFGNTLLGDTLHDRPPTGSNPWEGDSGCSYRKRTGGRC